MTDPFDTVREAWQHSRRNPYRVVEYDAALASIEERLREAERLVLRGQTREAETMAMERRAEAAERERDEWKQSNNLLIEENYGLAASLEAAERELASAKVEIIDWKLAKADSDRERDALQHIIDCADTPLMRDVLRERDEALNAEEVAEQYREKAEARVAELEKQMAEGSATP